MSVLTLTSELVVGRDGVSALDDELAQLLIDTDAPATARWGPLMTWLRHQHGRTAWVVLVRRGGRLVAAAPLVRQMLTGLQRFDSMGENALPTCLPAVDDDAANELARAVVAQLAEVRGPWWLHLGAVEAGDRVVRALAQQLPMSRLEQGFEAPRLEFTPGAPLATYVSRNNRSALAKARNRIRGDGLELRVDWTDTEAQIVATIPEMVALYRRRSRQLNQNALLEQPAYREFFADMMCAYAADRTASLLTVTLDGRLASYALCLRSAGGLFVYSNRMAPDFATYSAGAIANAEVLRRAWADPGVAFLDWGGGIQRYKLSGNATLHPFSELRAWSGVGSKLLFDNAGLIRKVAGALT